MFLQESKYSIMTMNNALISGLQEDQFKLEMMVTQRAKEAPKTSKGLPVSLLVAIPETKKNTEVR